MSKELMNANILDLMTEKEITVGAALAEIEAFKLAIDAAKKEYDEMVQAVKAAMIASGYKKIETDRISVTYKDATTRETFDSKSFRKDHPDMYDEYAVISPVNDSILVKVKNA